MQIFLLKNKATPQQINEMLKTLETYIKVAVDIEREILAGGGILHADCESVLIQDGSKQENIWGADWIPTEKKVNLSALINIAPRRKNRSMEILDPQIRSKVETLTRKFLEVD